MELEDVILILTILFLIWIIYCLVGYTFEMICKGMTDETKEYLGIHSPSKEICEIGSQLELDAEIQDKLE